MKHYLLGLLIGLISIIAAFYLFLLIKAWI